MKLNTILITTFLLILTGCSISKDLDKLTSREMILPTVIETNMLNENLFSSTNNHFSLKFNTEMDRVSFKDGVSLKRGGIDSVDIELSWLNNYQLSIIFQEDLFPDNPYTLTIKKGIKSTSEIVTNEEIVYKFIVYSKFPNIIGTTPANGEVGVSIEQVIVVTFETAMNEETVSFVESGIRKGAFSLLDSNNNSISGVGGWPGKSFRFIPDTKLTPLSVYTIQVTDQAKDIFGYSLAENYSSSFITEGEYKYTRTIYAGSSDFVATNSLDDLIFLDSSSDWVYKYDNKGIFILDFTLDGESGGVATHKTLNDIYISDTTGHRILKYNANGQLYGWIGFSESNGAGFHLSSITDNTYSNQDGAFGYPGLISIIEDSMLVVDIELNRISKFSLLEEPVFLYNLSFMNNLGSINCSDIIDIFSYQENIFIINNGRVDIFDITNISFIDKFPTDITVTSGCLGGNGLLYLYDADQKKVFVYDKNYTELISLTHDDGIVRSMKSIGNELFLVCGDEINGYKTVVYKY